MINKKYVNLALIVIFFVSLLISLSSVIFETNFQLDQAIARVGEKEISRQRFEEIIKILDDHTKNLLISIAKELAEPSEKDLREYFAKEKNYFSSGKRYKLKNYSFRNFNDAEMARNSLIKNNLENFLKLVTTENTLDLPDVFLTPQKIRDYLGPKALEELPSLEKGDFSNIYEINQVPSIIICIDILQDKNPQFEEIFEQIKNKFIRDREDNLVKEYIENLRNYYEIEKYSF